MQLRRLTTPVVIGVAVVTLTALAASAHGYPVQHVSLNDGSIWVTDNQAGDVLRFAKPIGQLDGELAPAPASTSGIDVFQNGPLVAVYSAGAAGGRIYAVNVDQPDFADPSGTMVSPVTPDTSGTAIVVVVASGSPPSAIPLVSGVTGETMVPEGSAKSG
jgi:hypothetical protein